MPLIKIKFLFLLNKQLRYLFLIDLFTKVSINHCLPVNAVFKGEKIIYTNQIIIYTCEFHLKWIVYQVDIGMKNLIFLILFFSSDCSSFTIHKQDGDININNSTLHENTNNYFNQEDQSDKNKKKNERNYQDQKSKTPGDFGGNYGFINYGRMHNSQQSFGYSQPKNHYGMNRRSAVSKEDGTNDHDNSQEVKEKNPEARSVEETTSFFKGNEEGNAELSNNINDNVTENLINEIDTDTIQVPDNKQTKIQECEVLSKGVKLTKTDHKRPKMTQNDQKYSKTDQFDQK